VFIPGKLTPHSGESDPPVPRLIPKGYPRRAIW
jgi:hypothetical protein